MDDLRKHLDENLHLLDDQEPMEGHFQRFEKRLDKFQLSRKKVKYLRFSAVAASVSVLISLGCWYFLKSDNIEIKDIYATQQYYQGKMTEKLASIECKLEKADSETQNQLKTDLRILQQENEEFLENMQENEDKEMVLKYLEQHYEINLKVLGTINSKLGDYIKC